MLVRDFEYDLIFGRAIGGMSKKNLRELGDVDPFNKHNPTMQTPSESTTSCLVMFNESDDITSMITTQDDVFTAMAFGLDPYLLDATLVALVRACDVAYTDDMGVGEQYVTESFGHLKTLYHACIHTVNEYSVNFDVAFGYASYFMFMQNFQRVSPGEAQRRAFEKYRILDFQANNL